MNEQNKFGGITSSVNPEKISTTILATAKMIAGIAVFAGWVTVAETTPILNGINQLITQVLALAPLVYAAWNSAEIVFGLIQKILVARFKKY